MVRDVVLVGWMCATARDSLFPDESDWFFFLLCITRCSLESTYGYIWLDIQSKVVLLFCCCMERTCPVSSLALSLSCWNGGER